jgi:diaminohydroxyphosphoribosylaminopyrimidine deaminase/5-amino-6-(5-phosphoribosylamino)uracil reductase
MSLDARTAPGNGVKAWVSGPDARADVQRWRARSGAIMTGAGTVRSDDPRLDVRLAYGPWVRQPLRVVLDPNLSCDPAAQIFQGDGALVFAALDAPSVSATALPGDLGGRRIERVPRAAHSPQAPGGLELGVILRRLAALEINELLVECGPRLAGAFLRAELVDELVLYVAPHLLGPGAPPLADVDGDLGAFEFRDVRRVGADLRLLLIPKKV